MSKVGAFLIVLLAWVLGAFVGGWVAGKLAGRSPIKHGFLVGVLMLVGAIGNMLAIPHPVWMWIGGIIAFLGCSVAGGRCAAVKTPAAAASG